MSEKIRVAAAALVPDAFNKEVRSGWEKSHWVKIEGAKYHVVPEKELRYKLVLERDIGWTRVLTVKLGRRWDAKEEKLLPVLKIPKWAFVWNEADEVGPITERVLKRDPGIVSGGIWDGLYQYNPMTREARVCEDIAQYEELNWIKLVPAESVWSSFQTVQLPNWAVKCAPRRPVGITPADRKVAEAWFGHFKAQFLAYANRNGWVIDPEDVRDVFRAMTEPEASDIVECQIDTHDIGRYILGEGEFTIKDDVLYGEFRNDNFTFEMKLRNNFTDKIVQFLQ